MSQSLSGTDDFDDDDDDVDMDKLDSQTNPEVVVLSQRQYQQGRFLASIDRLLSRKKLLLQRLQDMQDKLATNQKV